MELRKSDKDIETNNNRKDNTLYNILDEDRYFPKTDRVMLKERA